MSKPINERRLVTSALELRKAADGRSVLEGYAAVFGARSEDLGGFTEEVAGSAFTKTLKDGADVRALLNHDPNLILGRSTANTLRMSADSTGLHYEVDLGEQSYARDLAISLERGDITQSSFGFRTLKDDWIEDPEVPGMALRTLLEVRLHDVSPVTYPAYPDATSGLGKRALAAAAERRGYVDAIDDAMSLLKRIHPEPEAPSTHAFRSSVPLDVKAAMFYLTSR